MRNSGKKFEEQFKKSVPEHCLLQRLNDSPQAFKQSGLTRFTPKNPCDFFMYDSLSHNLFALELKSTKNNSVSFDDIAITEKQNKMIHRHQILGLLKFSQYDGVIAGFIFNFRDKKKGTETTYFQNIKDFMNMYKTIKKYSLNINDLKNNNAIEIKGIKKRVNYLWNIKDFLNIFERDYEYD